VYTTPDEEPGAARLLSCRFFTNRMITVIKHRMPPKPMSISEYDTLLSMYIANTSKYRLTARKHRPTAIPVKIPAMHNTIYNVC
jgi:phosphate uptake regulator